MAVQIREAEESDREGWIRLRHQLWPDCPEDKHRIEIEALSRHAGVVFMATMADGDGVGFVEVSLRSEHVEGVSIATVPYVEGWYVVPERRGRGVGRALMQAAEAWARRRGFAEIVSDAELENTVSQSMHLHLGFREVGRTVHFVKAL